MSVFLVRDLVKQLDTKVTTGAVKVQQRATAATPKAAASQPRPKPPAPQRTTSIPTNALPVKAPGPQLQQQGGGGPSDPLYVQADSLLASASKKESQGDLHTALAHVNRAIGQCSNQLVL